MCGTETDVCIKNNDNILLLLQEDKAYGTHSDPEPQLIAEAIAAFQYNNEIRHRYFHSAELDSYTFPCITMIGSYARFYKIPISQELNQAVIHGYKPSFVTRVECFDVLENDRLSTLGMAQLNARKKILQCFKLMREIMIQHATNL